MNQIRWFHSFRDGIQSKNVETTEEVYRRFDNFDQPELVEAIYGPTQSAVFTTCVIASEDDLRAAIDDFQIFCRTIENDLK